MRLSVSAAFCASLLATASLAEAHVSIASGPAAANATQKITFSVGHGCTVGMGAAAVHLDTVKVRVVIPTGISAVRALPNDFGKATVLLDGELVKEVTWTKAEADAGDFQYYELTLRARVEAAPFSTVRFQVYQTCRAPGSTDEVVVPWIDGPEVTDGNPAAALVVAPSHSPGWTKITIPDSTPTLTAAELGTYLGDALIVWRGTSAYSSNANTMAMVAATSGVTALATLQAKDEIWVKY